MSRKVKPKPGKGTKKITTVPPKPDPNAHRGKRFPGFVYYCFHCPAYAIARRDQRQYGSESADKEIVADGHWGKSDKGKYICPSCWRKGLRGEVVPVEALPASDDLPVPTEGEAHVATADMEGG